MKKIKTEIAHNIFLYENSKRIAFSKKYSLLKKPIIYLRQELREISNFFDPRLKYKRSHAFFNHIVARHQSVLRRKLGSSNPKLQEQKIINLQQAIKQLNGVIIRPGHVFSLWKILKKPSYTAGYVDGMLLANGKVIVGVGGGLCQLSNFLYWIFLHAPVEVIERHHHSKDIFPDSGRTLPFGSGATIFYNYVDLKVKNLSSQPLQLKIWLTDNHLKGQILSTQPPKEKFHVFEKNHFFVKRDDKYFRFNEIYRETKVQGSINKVEKVATNFAPVLYELTPTYIPSNNFQVLDFSKRKVTKLPRSGVLTSIN